MNAENQKRKSHYSVRMLGYSAWEDGIGSIDQARKSADLARRIIHPSHVIVEHLPDGDTRIVG